MTAALNLQTIEAHPLGKPSDRFRYGMTPAMAIVYADLVKRFGDKPDEWFLIYQAESAPYLGWASATSINRRVDMLVERGWLERPIFNTGHNGMYRFVHPIMQFPSVPTRWEDK